MSDLSRRSFLKKGAAAGVGLSAAASAPAAASASTRTRVPLIREEHRVVVIGSGFGGGISALRFAQAGVPVLVLERGRRWLTGPNARTFPSPTKPDSRLLWYESQPTNIAGIPLPSSSRYVGLIQAVQGQNMTALCAAAVGGGSLLYQGMTLQPTEELFHTQLPEGLDYRTMDAVHYPRVAKMLRIAEAPDELIATPTYKAARVFGERVEAAGYPLSKIPMPIDWNYALAETRGEMRRSYTNGDGAIGVNNGGKHTIDVTYLADAERTGLVTVATEHNVTRLRRAPDGRWEVYVNHTDQHGRVLEEKIITAKTLVMAAGSLNTTKLLVEGAGSGDIPDMPDDLGKGWGTNGDRIYVWRAGNEDFGAVQGGPVIYGSKDWADPATANTVIQASLPPVPFLPRQHTMLVGFGISDDRGAFVYDGRTGKAQLRWPRGGDAAVAKTVDARLRKIAGRNSTLIDTTKLLPNTWHALGGACMETVCDLEGRVHGQPGLYVLDGALIPGGTAACNPSMTIAAVAERAMDDIVRRDVGTLI